MLYFADKQREVDTQAVLRQVRGGLRDCATRLEEDGERAVPRVHPRLVAADIALGELFQAVADEQFPDQDGATWETDLLGGASIALGRAIFQSYRALRSSAPSTTALLCTVHEAAEAVARVASLDLPGKLTVKIPEGYAFYSLFPEMYFASAERIVAEKGDGKSFLAIGIRSIGTSLAGLVAGAFLEAGRPAGVETVRPRGHPFDRRLNLDRSLLDRLASVSGDTVFVVVDEGPGLTCSSFISVTTALEKLGVSGERIVVASAWRGVPSIYASAEARSGWESRRVYYTDASQAFEQWTALIPFVETEVRGIGVRGDRPRPRDRWVVRDISYGRWRERCYDSERDWPAIHRPAERTKLLLTSEACYAHPGMVSQRSPVEAAPPEKSIFAKFVGLGEYGRAKLERATRLAQAGFAPPVLGLAYGFLLQDFVPGRPLDAADLSDDIVRRLARYYAFVGREFALTPAPRFDQLAEMMAFNVSTALDIDAGRLVEYWRPWKAAIDSQPLVLLDGRPFPHEWLEVNMAGGTSYLKTDGADHCLDHTLVGEQSILWDIGGACEEWKMSPERVSLLIDSWEADTGDCSGRQLLDFYRTAYLAFRTAELHYAIHATNEEEVRGALQRLQADVNRRLRAIVESIPDPSLAISRSDSDAHRV
ncbi:MAG TPA: hypothetical protein VF960_00875 [Chloroflexota bacterium]